MSTTAIIARNEKRKALAAKYEAKRKELKEQKKSIPAVKRSKGKVSQWVRGGKKGSKKEVRNSEKRASQEEKMEGGKEER